MLVLVTYDVSTVTSAGRRRLRQVAKALQNRGVRVQLSVFECDVDPAQWTMLKSQLEGIIDKTCDSLRFYYLGTSKKRQVEHVGAKVPLDLDGPLLL
ncbi:MAG: CRISPR-associated endonuclease Cas2 [Rhodospirillales bacterium]|nr:CRISPR-associated endonuclease Cas2 [Rhodospirillales bacterium]